MLQKLSAARPSLNRILCYWCGRSNHSAHDCKFKDAECHNCHKKGHIAPACQSKKLQKPFGKPSARPNKCHSQKTSWIASNTDDEASDANNFTVLTIGEKSSRPISVYIVVNSQQLHIKVDIGAAVTIISEETQRIKFPNVPLCKSNIILRTYTGEQMHVLGELQVKVQYKSQEKVLDMIVVAGSGPSLLGRN